MSRADEGRKLRQGTDAFRLAITALEQRKRRLVYLFVAVVVVWLSGAVFLWLRI